MTATLPIETLSPPETGAGESSAVGTRILVVEDEVIIASDIQRRLGRMGYPLPAMVHSGEDALQHVMENEVDLVLMDIRLGGPLDGVEVAGRIRHQVSLPVIFLTAHSDPNTLQRARETAPFGYLTKPFQDRELYACIELALYRHKAETELRRREQWLGAVLRGIGDAVVATDAEGRVLFMNTVAERLLGWREHEVVGREFSGIFNIVGELSRRPVTNPVTKALAEGRPTTIIGDVILISRNGTQIPIADSAAPIWDHEGRIVGAVMVFRDNTETRRAAAQIQQLNSHLERRVEERTAELEAANRELAAFSYSVSHDLRAPLRHLDGYTQLLRQEAGPRLSEESLQYLNIISGASKRMGKLIDDLLSFCRTGRVELVRAPVNNDELVAEVLGEMDFGERADDIQWQVSPLAAVTGDRAMLKQVWINLVSNAVKYSRKRERPAIRIGCTVRDNLAEFFVADNGVGFDMKFVHKLFGVFERLHRDDEFEGTGIGLANVRRIVVRHGGKVRAEGQLGAGATFYFSLPILAAGTTKLPPESQP